MNRDQFERQWLAGLPSSWTEKRADFLCDSYRVTVDPEIYGDELVAHYSIPQVQATGGPAIEPASDIDSSKLLISEPTLLVSKLNPRKSTVCIAVPDAELPTLASGEFVPIRSGWIDQKYAYYLWSSAKITDRLSAIVHSVTRSHQRVNPADITKLPWKWPPLEIQRRIACFLDEKIARIDALTGRKRALLDRLAEKRQAIITQAVTKGLDPNAPMKDSGIEWLGEVPAGWDVKSLRYISTIGNGSTPQRDDPAYWQDGFYPWLNSSVVNLAHVSDASDWVTECALRECHLPRIDPPAVLVGITGQGRTRGMASLLVCEATINQHLAYIKPNHEAGDASYIRYVIGAAYSFLRNESESGGSTKGAITCEQLGHMKVPVPPYDQQLAISARIDAHVGELDQVIECVQRSVDLFEEYRAALITAAVTGQAEVDAAAFTGILDTEPTDTLTAEVA